MIDTLPETNSKFAPEKKCWLLGKRCRIWPFVSGKGIFSIPENSEAGSGSIIGTSTAGAKEVLVRQPIEGGDFFVGPFVSFGAPGAVFFCSKKKICSFFVGTKICKKMDVYDKLDHQPKYSLWTELILGYPKILFRIIGSGCDFFATHLCFVFGEGFGPLQEIPEKVDKIPDWMSTKSF